MSWERDPHFVAWLDANPQTPGDDLGAAWAAWRGALQHAAREILADAARAEAVAEGMPRLPTTVDASLTAEAEALRGLAGRIAGVQ